MTSSGGGDGGNGRSPAAPRAVVYDLMEVRERAALLQTMLQGSPTLSSAAGDAGELMEGMMTRLSSALSALDTGGGGSSSSVALSAGVGRGSGGRRKRGAAAGPHHRSSSRRRSKSPFFKTVTATTISDGKSWRKYGQKRIQDSTNPRSYYRCTHRPDQGCMATRQVQESESNPSEFVISYFGQHTCRDPSTIPLIFEGAAAPPDCANLISFASTIGGGATTSTSADPYHFVKEAIDHPMLSCFASYSSPPAQEMSTSEGALSSSLTPGNSPSPAAGEKFTRAGQLVAAGRTSALTVGSAPAEYWPAVGVTGDMAGGGTGSFPSSPSSLGFMTGSFGSFGNNVGDDDLFGFDP